MRRHIFIGIVFASLFFIITRHSPIVTKKFNPQAVESSPSAKRSLHSLKVSKQDLLLTAKVKEHDLNRPQQLLIPFEGVVKTTLDTSYSSRERYVRFDDQIESLEEKSHFKLQLFDDAQCEFVVDYKKDLGRDYYEAVGHLVDSPRDQVLIVYHKPIVHMNILLSSQNEQYQIRRAHNDIHRVIQVDYANNLLKCGLCEKKQ